METKINYKYYEIIRKIKQYFECQIHTNNKYIAYCSICNINICDKCLNNSLHHIGHTIFYFQKIMLLEKQVKYYRTIYYLCTFYLKRIREIVIELLSDLSDIIISEKKTEEYSRLLNIKSQLKNAYKHFYKQNIYQMQYAKNNLELFIYCKKWGYINYQVIKNIYNIKLNSVKIPELQDKDIINKIEIMIDFMKNNNNILMPSDMEHPTTFYSYIDYNSKNPKVNIYTVKLSSMLFDINRGEIFNPNNINDSNSDIETNISENINENDNINKININENNNINNKSNNFIILKEKKYEDLNNINNRIISLKENLSKINNSINNHKIIEINENNNIIKNKIYQDVYQDEEYYYKTKNKNNLKENKNINKINYIKEENSPNKINNNNISSNEKIKNYIYSSLSKTSKEEVEYRDNIQYIYLDKNAKKEINCKYYGEFKKGTLKRHGRGLFIWEDGEIYLGYWANDKREGEGTNTYPNGNIYQGNYKNGKKEGDGIYKWKNGDKYKGKWKNDMKDGKGIYEYSNGDIYDGYFKKDKIDGNGSYTWANKITYKGQFKNNLIDKKGI